MESCCESSNGTLIKSKNNKSAPIASNSMKARHTQNVNTYSIAIVGTGFSGLCVVSYLIQFLKNKKDKVSITLFDPQKIEESIAYNVNLPDSFKLNHEAKYMGIINPSNVVASYDDFFIWIQENLHKSLRILGGKTLTEKYFGFELRNPESHLPRSIYGYYLMYRFEQIKSGARTGNYEFKYQSHHVSHIQKKVDAFQVFYNNTSNLFDFVVLSTGDFYAYKEKDIFYSSLPSTYLGNEKISKDQHIGILGSSLSAIETAIALADLGYQKISMFSRHGRLPKIRGKTTLYKPRYITKSAITNLRGKTGTVNLETFLRLIKKELDYAYSLKGQGWYQKKGVYWGEIASNSDPLKQLDEDIKKAKSGEEFVWRSVLFGLQDVEMDFWESLTSMDLKLIIEQYATLILMHFSPMPLIQAEKLKSYLNAGIITLSYKLIGYKQREARWEMSLHDRIIPVAHLIDARGYSQEAANNPLISSLITSGLLEKHQAFGIRANKKHQAISQKGVEKNLYAIGTILNGALPLKASTPYINQFAKEIASHIVKSL